MLDCIAALDLGSWDGDEFDQLMNVEAWDPLWALSGNAEIETTQYQNLTTSEPKLVPSNEPRCARPGLWLRQSGHHPVISGGQQLLERVRQILSGSPEAAKSVPPLQFVRSVSIEAHGAALATRIDANGSSWALAAIQLDRYELLHRCPSNQPLPGPGARIRRRIQHQRDALSPSAWVSGVGGGD